MNCVFLFFSLNGILLECFTVEKFISFFSLEIVSITSYFTIQVFLCHFATWFIDNKRNYIIEKQNTQTNFPGCRKIQMYSLNLRIGHWYNWMIKKTGRERIFRIYYISLKWKFGKINRQNENISGNEQK